MFDAWKYKTPVSFFQNIPIEHLDETKKMMRDNGWKFRIRYRGERNHPNDLRPKWVRRQDCLKEFAKTFSVYRLDL